MLVNGCACTLCAGELLCLCAGEMSACELCAWVLCAGEMCACVLCAGELCAGELVCLRTMFW